MLRTPPAQLGPLAGNRKEVNEKMFFALNVASQGRGTSKKLLSTFVFSVQACPPV